MTDKKQDSEPKLRKTGWQPDFDERMGISFHGKPRPDKRTTIEVTATPADADETFGSDAQPDADANGTQASASDEPRDVTAVDATGDHTPPFVADPDTATQVIADDAPSNPTRPVQQDEDKKDEEASEDNGLVTKNLKSRLDQPIQRLGSARFDGPVILEIELLVAQVRFSFPYSEVLDIALGRRDHSTGITPQVDLTAYGGSELGVSRQHATIKRQGVSLYLVDHRSINGTYLNGQELLPEQPRMLRDGDDIQLGKLTLRIHYRIDRNVPGIKFY